MSDEQTTETETTDEVVTDAPAEAVETTEVDPFDDENTTTFERAYVEKLRKENAKYRERAKSFESAFDGYSDEAREFVLTNLVPSLVNDYEGTIKALASELGITKAEAEQIVEDETGVTGEAEDKPLTRAEAERLWQEKEQARQEAEEAKRYQQEIIDEVKALGFDATVDDKGMPTNPDTKFLMLLARDSYDSDLAKAAEAIEAGRQAIIAEHIAKLEAENGKAPAPVRSSGVGGVKGEPPKTLAEARAAANAALEAKYGNGRR